MPWSPPPLPSLTPADPGLLPHAQALLGEPPAEPAAQEQALRALLASPEPAVQAGLRAALAAGLDGFRHPSRDWRLEASPAERHRDSQAAYAHLARLRRLARALVDAGDAQAEALLAARLSARSAPEVISLAEEVLVGHEPGGFSARPAGRAALEALVGRGPAVRSAQGVGLWARALLLLGPERALAELGPRLGPEPRGRELARHLVRALRPEDWADLRWAELLATHLAGPDAPGWLLEALSAHPQAAARALAEPMPKEAFARLLEAVARPGPGQAGAAQVLAQALPGLPERRSKRDGRRRADAQELLARLALANRGAAR